MTRLTLRLLGPAAAILLAACSEAPEPTSPTIAPPASLDAPQALQDAVVAETGQACSGAEALQDSITTFLDNPGADTLVPARQQWKASHQAYGRLLAAYQLARMNPPQIAQDRDPIDAHPVLPGYLDRVPGYPRSGLVYSEVPLTPGFLQEEHQSTDFFYLTLGFHPLEVLLWGGIDPRPEFRAQLFQRRDNQDPDQVDSRSRRIELLRLVAHALSRDTTQLCAHNNRLALVNALATVAATPAEASRALDSALETLLDQPLALWQAYPEGEDRNGMPIWHSPYARSDFQWLKAQLAAWHGTWLELLLPAAASAGFTEQVEALGQRLDALDGSVPEPDPALVSEARALVVELRQSLAAATAASQGEDSEEAGQ